MKSLTISMFASVSVFVALFLFVVFSYPAQAPAQSLGYGTNLIQRFWEGSASTTPQGYYSAGGYCYSDSSYHMNVDVDSNGYTSVSYLSSITFFTNHHGGVGCNAHPNASYRVPVSLPTVNNGWSLYAIVRDSDTVLGTGGAGWWVDGTGADFDTALIASSTAFSFGGENYRIYQYGGLVSASSEGFLEKIVFPSGVTFSADEGVVAIVYGGSDLISGINTATQLKDYLDTLYGFDIGSPTPASESSRITEQNAPTSLILTSQVSGSTEFSFDYYSTGNVGKACVYFYYPGTSGWIPSCVESIPDFVGYQSFSLNQDLADDTIYRYYFTIETASSWLGSGVQIARTSTGVYSVGSPSVGATNTVWEDMANDPATWGYSSSTVSQYWEDADISGIYTALNSECDSRFPVDNSSIISATVGYLPNGLCKVVYGLFFDTSDAQISSGAHSLYDDFMQFPPISALMSMVNIFPDLTPSSL